MRLRRAIVPVSFGNVSIGSGKDPKLSGTWTRLENVVQDLDGEIRKRTGLALATADTTVQDSVEARQIATLGGRPVVIGNRGVATLPSGSSDLRQTGPDDDLIGQLDARRVWSRVGENTDVAHTQTFGVLITSQEEAYGTYGPGWVVSFDLETGDVIQAIPITDMYGETPNESAGARASVRVLELNGTIHYFYVLLSSADRYIAHGSFGPDGTHTPAVSTGILLGSTSADIYFDALVTKDWLVLAYRDDSGDVVVARSADGASWSTGAVEETGVFAPQVYAWEREPGIVHVSWVRDDDPFWNIFVAAWDVDDEAVELTSDSVLVIPFTASSPSAPTAITGVGDTMLICLRDVSSAPGLHGAIREYSISDDGGACDATLDRTLYGPLLATKAVRFGADSFIFGVHYRAALDTSYETAADTFIWLAHGEDWYRPVAKAAIGRAKWDWGASSGVKSTYDCLCQIQLVPDGTFRCALRSIISRPPSIAWRRHTDPALWTSRTHVVSYALDFNAFSGDGQQHIDAGETLYLGGAMPRAYDGQAVFEQGFLTYPAKCYMETADTTGDELSYVATYEHVDAASGRWQSIPSSVPATYVGTAGDTVAVHVPTLTLTSRSGVRILLWRSVAGGPYYRVGALDNDMSVPYVEFTDEATEAEGELGELLYTNGNILEYEQPPAYSAAAIYDSRMWIAPVEERGRRVWFSSRRADFRPHPFSEVLSLELPGDGGPVTSMSRLGERILIALADMTLASWGGPGPDDIGTGPTYQTPYLLSPSMGCLVPGSAIEHQSGVAWRSRDALWSVGSDGGIQPIGDGARWYSDRYSVVPGAASADRTEIAWPTSDGPAIAFDWMRQGWKTYTWPQSYGAVRGAILGTDGRLWTDSDRYLDGDEPIRLRLETGWIPIGQLLGHGHVEALEILGASLGGESLDISWGWDYDPEWHGPYSLSLVAYPELGASAHYDGVSAGAALIGRARPPRSRMTAIRVRIEESSATEGASVSGISLALWLRGGQHPVGSDGRIE